MPGRARASNSGRDLTTRVTELGETLGLSTRTEVRVGRRLWGAIRRIDVVLTDASTRRTLGIECKFQGTPGSAEEKIPATVSDIAAWPIPGLVVFDGDGFSVNMRQFLISTGKAVELEDLEDWLRLYFGLPERLITRASSAEAVAVDQTPGRRAADPPAVLADDAPAERPAASATDLDPEERPVPVVNGAMRAELWDGGVDFGLQNTPDGA